MNMHICILCSIKIGVYPMHTSKIGQELIGRAGYTLGFATHF